MQHLTDNHLAVTIVVPTLREAPNLEPLAERAARVLASRSLAWELLLVDDDSDDDTLDVAGRLARRLPLRIEVRRDSVVVPCFGVVTSTIRRPSAFTSSPARRSAPAGRRTSAPRRSRRRPARVRVDRRGGHRAPGRQRDRTGHRRVAVLRRRCGPERPTSTNRRGCRVPGRRRRGGPRRGAHPACRRCGNRVPPRRRAPVLVRQAGHRRPRPGRRLRAGFRPFRVAAHNFPVVHPPRARRLPRPSSARPAEDLPRTMCGASDPAAVACVRDRCRPGTPTTASPTE